jgi:hypothetical protein
MKDEKEDADQAAPAVTDVLEAKTLRRIESIRKPDESFDGVLTRVLDNAVKNVSIEALLTNLLTQFEEAVSIDVDLSGHSDNVGKIYITVYTGKAELEEYVTLYEGVESRAVIESESGEEFRLPFSIAATCSGPQLETISTTPVYVTDNIRGMDPVSLDEGINRLRTKIGKPHEELQELVHDH